MTSSTQSLSAINDTLERRVKAVLDEMFDVRSEYHFLQHSNPDEADTAEDLALDEALEAARAKLTDAWRIARYATLRRDFPYLPAVEDFVPGASVVREILIRAHELIIENTTKPDAPTLAQKVEPLVTTLRQWGTFPELAHLRQGLESVAKTLQASVELAGTMA